MDATWLSDLGMVDDDYYNKSADQWNNVMRWMQDDGDDQFLSHDIASVLHANCYSNNNNIMQPCLSSESHSSKSISNNNSSTTTTADEITNMCDQTMNWKTTASNIMCEQQYSSSSNYNSQLLCFEKCNNNTNNSDDGITKQRFYGFDQCGNTNKKENIEESDDQKMEVKRVIPQVRDHIMAERKRREKLSQSFIALSALVPGLKKMDKASVLGDAIKYVKELKERVRMLELEQHKKKRRKVESVVVVKKSHVCTGGDDNNAVNGELAETSLPEVEARVSHKDVLLRIFCHQHKGLFVKILYHIQNNLHLHVLNSCVVPFAHSNLDLTIIAQMGEDYSLTVEDLVKNIRLAILSLYDMNEE